MNDRPILRTFSVFAVAIALVCFSGCAANQWNRDLGGNFPIRISEKKLKSESDVLEKKRPGFWHQTFGQPSGDDPIARDIERRLGIGTF